MKTKIAKWIIGAWIGFCVLVFAAQAVMYWSKGDVAAVVMYILAVPLIWAIYTLTNSE